MDPQLYALVQLVPHLTKVAASRDGGPHDVRFTTQEINAILSLIAAEEARYRYNRR